jgi:LPXTG-motif cell wall-anchored protein
VFALPIALLLALSVPALAQNRPPPPGPCVTTVCVRGAPGPLMGAGLPVLLIGGGIYWLVRRRKKGTPRSPKRKAARLRASVARL